MLRDGVVGAQEFAGEDGVGVVAEELRLLDLGSSCFGDAAGLLFFLFVVLEFYEPDFARVHLSAKNCAREGVLQSLKLLEQVEEGLRCQQSEGGAVDESLDSAAGGWGPVDVQDGGGRADALGDQLGVLLDREHGGDVRESPKFDFPFVVPESGEYPEGSVLGPSQEVIGQVFDPRGDE